ncbi:MAG: TonB-dependent receptor [Desulfobacterales bacterium]
MRTKITRWTGIIVIAGLLSPLFFLCRAGAEEEVKELETIVVKEKKANPQIVTEPGKTTINTEDYRGAGIPQNVSDFVKDLPIMNYRGGSELVPDSDTFYLRGFDSNRFVNAMDGLTIRKTGGRRGSNIVDYALLPPFLIESVEVMPGPHSALYPGKSIGGAVNFISRAPRRREEAKPDLSFLTSYGDYGTQNHSMSASGGAGDVTYDFGYQKYATDGYLRNHEADIDTVFGRLGYLLPNKGYVTLQASYSDADRQRPVVNDPDDPASDYDPDYPVREKTSGRDLYYDDKPTWDKSATYYRLNSKIPTPLGTWSAGAYYGEETRDHFDLDSGSWETHWKQRGARVSNEFSSADGHVTTVGTELAQNYDAHDNESYKKRIEIMSGFAQHDWQITRRLNMTAGLRYEDIAINVDNSSNGGTWISGEDEWIKRDWSKWSPKSFLTYELDDHADWLRDTSVSAGISRIWRAPDYHGDYNPQGKPTGAWLEPEHGTGYDAILSRRLAGNINLEMNYSYYRIKDFISYNRKFAEYTPSEDNSVEPGKEFKDYKINLEEVVRQGLELQLNGSLTENIDFMLGYAYQDFDNQGNEPAGEEEVSNRPEHRANAGLTWHAREGTRLILDYEYQDDQVSVEALEVAGNEYEFRETDVDAFHVFDLGVEQRLFDQWCGIKSGLLKVYVKNLFDRDYINSSGEPALDRTMGAALSFKY